MTDAYSVQQNLKGVNGHVHDVFIFSAKFQHVNDLVNNRNFEVFVLAQVVFENQLYDSNELHQQALLENGVLALLLIKRELQVEGFKETDGEVGGLN